MEARTKKRPSQEDKEMLHPEEVLSRAQLASFWPRAILVPVDLSLSSPASLQYAVVLASRVGARLIVLHVCEYSLTGSWAIDLARTLVSAANNVEDELMALAGREIPPTVPFKKLLMTGVPAQCIVRAASQEKADLIVMASHGRSGLEHARLGSVTEQVIRAAPCPVLVWPMQSVVQPEQ